MKTGPTPMAAVRHPEIMSKFPGSNMENEALKQGEALTPIPAPKIIVIVLYI